MRTPKFKNKIVQYICLGVCYTRKVSHISNTLLVMNSTAVFLQLLLIPRIPHLVHTVLLTNSTSLFTWTYLKPNRSDISTECKETYLQNYINYKPKRTRNCESLLGRLLDKQDWKSPSGPIPWLRWYPFFIIKRKGIMDICLLCNVQTTKL